jgi:hypothetical protein
MYGVIVVPTRATMRRTTVGERSSEGRTRAAPTAPQSGWDSSAEAM